MKALLLALATLPIFTSRPAFSSYTPPVQRYTATYFEGHSGEKDETARSCYLDIILIRQDLNQPFWVMLNLFSDPYSQMTFRPLIPTEIMPLADGATWTDFLGRSYSYRNGILASDDGMIRYETDGRFLFPRKAQGRSEGQNGLSGNWLQCEF